MILVVGLMPNNSIIMMLVKSASDFIVTEKKTGTNKSDDFLCFVDFFLTNNRIDLSLVESVVFFGGGESFTSSRIIASIANSLAYCLNIPIFKIANIDLIDDLSKIVAKAYFMVKQKAKEGNFQGSIVPDYHREPNIT